MAHQFGLCVEGLGAPLTQVVALVLVDVLDVATQQLCAVESLVALWAGEGLDPGVLQLVLPHVGGPYKVLAAVPTLCGLDLGVCGMMGLQVGLLEEAFPAGFTAKLSHTFMHGHVCVKVPPLGELLAAECAGPGLEVHVTGHHVLCQLVVQAELSGASRAQPFFGRRRRAAVV